MPQRRPLLGVLVLIASVSAANLTARAAQLCVGAFGSQKAGYCKLQYEAYVTTGTCRGRDGEWDPRYTITLNINRPTREAIQARRYVNRNHTEGPWCVSTVCASASATAPGVDASGNPMPSFRVGSRCNKRSYD